MQFPTGPNNKPAQNRPFGKGAPYGQYANNQFGRNTPRPGIGGVSTVSQGGPYKTALGKPGTAGPGSPARRLPPFSPGPPALAGWQQQQDLSKTFRGDSGLSLSDPNHPENQQKQGQQPQPQFNVASPNWGQGGPPVDAFQWSPNAYGGMFQRPNPNYNSGTQQPGPYQRNLALDGAQGGPPVDAFQWSPNAYQRPGPNYNGGTQQPQPIPGQQPPGGGQPGMGGIGQITPSIPESSTQRAMNQAISRNFIDPREAAKPYARGGVGSSSSTMAAGLPDVARGIYGGMQQAEQIRMGDQVRNANESMGLMGLMNQLNRFRSNERNQHQDIGFNLMRDLLF